MHCREKNLLEFLRKHGFQSFISQYEKILEI